MLLVSHNRRLLDRTVTRILELKGGRVREYTGNYSAYQLTRLQALVAQRADYVASQKRIAQLEALVARLAAIAAVRTDKAHGKRLRARRTQLAREENRAVARPDVKDAAVSVVLPEAESRANVALQVIGYDRSFGDRVLFRDAHLEIACGERLALVGPNGCGKSTLLRDIVTHGDWEDPVLRVGPSLTIGYCAQHQETLEEEQTILEAFLAMGLGNRQAVLAALSGYLFGWDDLDKPVGALSGGERNRPATRRRGPAQGQLPDPGRADQPHGHPLMRGDRGRAGRLLRHGAGGQPRPLPPGQGRHRRGRGPRPRAAPLRGRVLRVLGVAQTTREPGGPGRQQAQAGADRTPGGGPHRTPGE